MTNDKPRCIEKVIPSGRYGSFNRYQCQKPAMEGSKYCKVHDPANVQAKHEERHAKYEAESNAKQAERQLRINAHATVVKAAEAHHDMLYNTHLAVQACDCDLAAAIRVMYRVRLQDPSMDR